MNIIVKGFFYDSDDIPRSRKALLYLLEALTNMNRVWLKFQGSPSIYESGVRYMRDPGHSKTPKEENWIIIPEVIDNGGSDCKNLAAWRCAEQREKGVICRPYLKWKRRNNGTLYHVLVQYGIEVPGTDGGFEWGYMEDPSRLLGMGGNE